MPGESCSFNRRIGDYRRLFKGINMPAQSSFKRQAQILVIGSDGDHCPSALYETAREVGGLIASHGAVLVTGGLGGVMEASCRGAKERGGTGVGDISHLHLAYANA